MAISARCFFVVVAVVAIIDAFAQVSGPREVEVVDGIVLPLSDKFGSLFWSHAPETKFGSSWAASPMTDGATFRRIRQGLEKKFSSVSPRSTLGIVTQLRSRAALHDSDPAVVFAWATGAILESGIESRRGKSYWVGRDRLRERGAMAWLLAAMSPQPNDYEFMRLRFLIETGRNVALGRRLLRHTSDDPAVERALASELGVQKNLANTDEALGIVDKLLRPNPSDLGLIGLKGFIYQRRYLQLGYHKTDADKAIEWYQTYLATCPKGAPNIEGAEMMVKMIRERSAKGK